MSSDVMIGCRKYSVLCYLLQRISIFSFSDAVYSDWITSAYLSEIFWIIKIKDDIKRLCLVFSCTKWLLCSVYFGIEIHLEDAILSISYLRISITTSGKPGESIVIHSVPLHRLRIYDVLKFVDHTNKSQIWIE